MDAVRYWLALLALLMVPQAILYWFIVHPFISTWRRLGKGPTYALLTLMYVGCGYLLWRARGPLLATEYGTNPWLWGPAALLYIGANAIQMMIRKQLRFSVLAGSPELEAGGKGGELLETGVYARVRHPRYIAVVLGVAAWALFTNYLAIYALVPALIMGLAGVAWFEERELLERFGEPYADYRARVPMLFPRLGARG
ncbi:MAG: isoprenylcysteine carboxylmethyltransferase family protein [Gemmatimonadetes bacterium]|nr:isoprenylcysteine carboxylmethyltransferase family protein [Gemmatimonadota bacterium]